MHFPPLKFDFAVDQGEERVIPAAADVKTGVELRAALAKDDRSCPHHLPAVCLDATVLRIAVSAVSRRTGAFLMSHNITSGPARFAGSRKLAANRRKRKRRRISPLATSNPHQFLT